MKALCRALMLCGLAACGVDGDPVQPSGGVNVTVDSSVGMSGRAVTAGAGF